ncbi:hypothetical protein [Pseudolysinimonas sp.]|uniref:hypothetical protein n=1 Tax=Pseudolysinimonas sp. TaxID=2680009 RepID=UPI003264052A
MTDPVDPRYPRRFQRGQADEIVPAEKGDVDPADPPVAHRPLPVWALLVLAGVLIGGGVAALILATLDPSLESGVRPGVSTEHRALARVVAVAAGPILVAAVLALVAWAAVARPRYPVAALAVPAVSTFAAAGSGVATALEIARLDGLVAPGRVSSGGIPLSRENLVIYLARVQADAVLVDLLPWLVAATAFALAGTVVAAALRR